MAIGFNPSNNDRSAVESSSPPVSGLLLSKVPSIGGLFVYVTNGKSPGDNLQQIPPLPLVKTPAMNGLFY